MPNKTSAKEWLNIAYHDLKSAKILYEANHFTDSIGNDLQQSLEKILKSILAHENKQIKKSQDLVENYYLVLHCIQLQDEEISLLEQATEYHREDRYPNPHYSLPPRAEIKEILDFTEKLFDYVCDKLDIDKEEMMNAD
jgi:HEPN domain-containing protein